MAKTRSMTDTITEAIIWMTTANEKYPHIVEGGYDKVSRETLYVGRAKVGNSIVPGKVFKGPRGHGLYAALGEKEHYLKNYEMIVTTSPVEWIADSGGNFPSNAIPGGTNVDGETLYIARAIAPDGGKCPGYLFPPDKVCVFSYDGRKYEAKDYDVLVEEES